MHSRNNQTDLKKRIIELEKQLEFYKVIVENSYNWELFRNERGEIEYVNKAFEKITGFSREDFINGKITIKDFIYPDDLSIVQATIQKAMGKEAISDFEFRVVRADNEVRYMNLYAVPVFDGEVFRGVRTTVRDITDQKQYKEIEELHEELLQSKQVMEESEEKHRFLFENMTQGVVYHDKRGKIVYANQAAADILGLTLDQLYGKTSLDPRWRAIHEDGSEYPGNDHPAMITLKTGKPVKNVLMGVFHAEKNTYLWINTNSIPKFKNPGDKKPDQVIVTFEDVTDLKKAYQKADESEQLYRDTFEKAEVGIAHVNKKGGFIRINNKFCDMLGYQHNELLKMNIADITHPEDLNIEAEFINKVINNERNSFVIEKRYFHKKGHIIWVNLHSNVVRDKENNVKYAIASISEITKQKELQQELLKEKERAEESEMRFKALHNASFGGIAIHDKGIILDCNEGLSKMTGYSLDELTGMNGLLLIAEHDRPRTIDNINKKYEKPYEVDGIRKNGEEYPIRIEAREIPYAGKMVRVTEFRDITQKKKAENVLKKNEALQRKMVANIGDVIVIIDKDGINRYKSPNIKRLFGWEVEDVVGKNTWENIHADDLSYAQKFFNEIMLKPNATGTIELRYRHKDGSYRYIEFTAVNLLHDSDINGILGNYREITERKETERILLEAKEQAEKNEKALKIQNELFSILLENLNHGVFLVEAPSGKPLIANKAAQKLLGRGILPDANAKNIAEVYNAYKLDTNKPYPAEEMPIIKGLHGESSYVDDLVVQRPDGTKTLLEIYGTPVADPDGNIWASLVSFSDITERKKSEQELIEAKEKAEESDQLKTAFLQNMSHEIRTPMNAIVGFSDFLEKPDLSEKKKNRYTSIIKSSANQLLSIVSDVLTISSLETRQEKLNIEKVCINQILNDLMAIFKQQSLNKNVPIKSNKELSDKQSEVYTDATKVTQVLTNLLSNAVKFTHEGYIEYGYKKKIKELEFYVKDTGPGIAKKYHEAIFERFRQTNLAINKKYGGTGLGLSISKGFTELLGGKIWVNSKPGEGSAFYFTIPYHPVKELHE